MTKANRTNDTTTPLFQTDSGVLPYIKRLRQKAVAILSAKHTVYKTPFNLEEES